MRAFVALSISLALTTLVGCGGRAATESTTVADDTTSTVTLVNASSVPVYHVFFSPVDDASWGADLLGDDVLLPGESATVVDVACDVWDVRIIDEDGSDCVLESVAICAEDGGLVLEDGDLAVCEAFGS